MSFWDTPQVVDPPSRDYRMLAACLAWLAARAGRPVSAERLLASLPDGRGGEVGLDIEGIATALRHAGLTLEEFSSPRGDMPLGKLPALVLMDPTGMRVVGFAAAPGQQIEARSFSPTVPGGEPVDAGLHAASAAGPFFRIAALPMATMGDDLDTLAPRHHWYWSVFWREAGTYAHVAVAAVAINVIALVSSLYTMAVYDRVIPSNSLVTLWTLTGGVALVYAFDLVFRILRGLLVDISSRRVDVIVGRDLFEHVLGMRLEHRVGSTGTTANMVREFATVQDFFSSATLLAVVDLPFVFLFLAVLWTIAPVCMWPVLLAIPLVLVSGLLIQSRLSTLSRMAYIAGQEKHGALVETLASLEAIRGLGAERAMRRRWRDRVASSALSGSHVRTHQQLAVNLSITIQQFATLGVVVVGCMAIVDGQLSMGALIAAVILSGRALAPLSQIAQILTRYNLTRVSMKAIDRFLATPVERPEGRTYLDRPRLRGAYELREVEFSYPGANAIEVLNGVTVTLRPGEKVGILGRVGSGKSTLLKLLMGMYQPTGGTLRIDGVDLRQIDPAQLRAQVAYVPQAPILFSGTVRENIAIARPEASDGEILRAAALSGADAFIARHPLGYDMPIGERGEGLSIGQRQAIALAQALIKDAEVIVMDEPTSAMDDRTEDEFRRGIAPLLEGKTMVLVTHKRTMLELVDRLILVDNGRIAIDGPKEAVLRALMAGEIRVHAP